MGSIRKGLWIGFCFSLVSALVFAAQQPTPPTKNISPSLVDCNALDDEEQEFAAELTDGNKTLFCGKFTPAQRAAAMDMVDNVDAQGAEMTPDDAVQKVAGSSKPSSSKGAGGCPVK